MRLLLVLGLSCLLWAGLTASASAPPVTAAGGDDVPELEVPVEDNEENDTRDDGAADEEEEEPAEEQASQGGGGGTVMSPAPAPSPTTLPYTGKDIERPLSVGLVFLMLGLVLRYSAPSASSSARLRSRPQR
jgi:hypothetical protein